VAGTSISAPSPPESFPARRSHSFHPIEKRPRTSLQPSTTRPMLTGAFILREVDPRVRCGRQLPAPLSATRQSSVCEDPKQGMNPNI